MRIHLGPEAIQTLLQTLMVTDETIIGDTDVDEYGVHVERKDDLPAVKKALGILQITGATLDDLIHLNGAGKNPNGSEPIEVTVSGGVDLATLFPPTPAKPESETDPFAGAKVDPRLAEQLAAGLAEDD